MKRILLVAPGFEPPHWTARNFPLSKAKAFITPLHIATVAGLTPHDIEVDLWDEVARGLIDEETALGKQYDLVGLTSDSLSLRRTKEIARIFRRHGIPVAIGGSGVSSVPEQCREYFDILFIGEAELTWPRFIADWESGSYRKEYRQIGFPDVALSPPPRWDSIADQMRNYMIGSVQTTRGCPFHCEFCSSTYLFGHRTRHKPIDRVLEEVATLEHLGITHVLFCDDNFSGNPRYARELLQELVSLNNSFQNPLKFTTQLDITVAEDESMLELLADANFSSFCIGIESPNMESLKETGKLQNVRDDLIADCKRFMSYGMNMAVTLIVGFDHDDKDIFDQHFEFIQKACIPGVRLNLLKAATGTRLWRQLLREGRVLSIEKGLYDEKGFIRRDIRHATNIIPKRMTRSELFSGYLNLMEKVYDWENFAERVKGMISYVKRKPSVPRQRMKWKYLLRYTKYLLSLDRRTRRVILSLIWYTRRNAPFMMRRVLGLIVAQHFDTAILPPLREAIRRQIESEESVDIEPFVESAEALVPQNFEVLYQEVFPEIHERVYLGLTDKTRTCEALIEIFKNFVIGFQETLQGCSEHPREYLHELADHIIVKANRTTGELYSAFAQANLTMLGAKRELAAGILKAVEEDLRVRIAIER
jgi:radical SAM superfamily enzyme YgiQ (UPF0313 family)